MEFSPLPLTVSAVIPVFNGERFLSRAINSILAQQVKPIEIIVVDDGSNDGTAKICFEYRQHISYVHKPNGGEGSARNLGLSVASGSLVAFLDADDEWLPSALKLLQEPFVKDDTIMLSAGYSQEISYSRGEWREQRQPYIGLQLSACMISRTAFERVGLFDESLRLAVDTDWLFRLREHNLPKKYVDGVVVRYRQHANNASLQDELLRSSLLKACRSSLDRRRSAGGDNLFLTTFGRRRSTL